jgi:hypothetical protein
MLGLPGMPEGDPSGGLHDQQHGNLPVRLQGNF